jgi:hypothetical protein
MVPSAPSAVMATSAANSIPVIFALNIVIQSMLGQLGRRFKNLFSQTNVAMGAL